MHILLHQVVNLWVFGLATTPRHLFDGKEVIKGFGTGDSCPLQVYLQIYIPLFKRALLSGELRPDFRVVLKR